MKINYHNGFCLRFVYKRGIIIPLGPYHHHHKTHFVFASINFVPNFLLFSHIIPFHFPSFDFVGFDIYFKKKIKISSYMIIKKKAKRNIFSKIMYVILFHHFKRIHYCMFFICVNKKSD